MPFFEDETPVMDGVCAEFALKLADMLLNHRRITQRPNLKRWSADFARLRKNYDDAVIRQVLAWLDKAVAKPFVPSVFSALTFCHKFPALEAAALRDGAWVDCTICADPEILRIIEHAGNLIWQKGEKRHEPEFVRQSLASYRNFLYMLETARIDRTKTHPYRVQCGKLWEFLSPPHTVVIGYLQQIHNMAQTWDRWHGNLLPWVWSPYAKLWRQEIESLIEPFGGFALVDVVLNAN